jgi:hypothetical protein
MRRQLMVQMIAALRVATRLVIGGLRWLARLLVAIVIVFEEWGWRPLAEALARLARFPFIAALERSVTRLPPYGALAVFVLPSAALLPLKLLSVYLIAGGHVVGAAVLFIGAKIAGTAVLARLFMLTQPQLMRIWWFARLYDMVVPWKKALLEWVRETWVWRYSRIVKARLTRRLERLRELWGPIIAAIRSAIGRVLGR